MVATKLWFIDDNIFIETDDGRTLWQSMLYYKRLMNASQEQRNNYVIGGFGIHWEDIDEDVSFDSFEYDNPEPSGISRFFLLHPELNVSAVARRMGMKQSLIAAYINGTKKPSLERENEIINTIRQIGKELTDVKL
ncbi:MAG: DUF2442 domain-containing protein [Bacteroidales bacterium]|jgi:hypothetical protein|nr:DUF2442 domain-containing protein [Bacteroidales bacterium]